MKVTIAVTKETRDQLDEIKRKLGFRSMSEAITYLVAHFDSTWGDIRFRDDQIYRDYVKKIEKKEVLV